MNHPITGPSSPHPDIAIGWRVLDAVIWMWQKVRVPRLRRFAGYFLVAPSVALIGVLAAGIVYLTWQSLHELDPVLQETGEFSTENYTLLVTDDYFIEAFARTLLVSTIVTVSAVILSLPLAYTIVSVPNRAWRFALVLIALLPFVAGELVRGYSWLIVLGQDGAVAWFADAIGLGRPTLVGTPFAISLGILQLLLPLSVLILLPSFRGINPELEQAASTLGARPRGVWFHIILPLVRRGIAAAVAISFTFSMTSFAMPTLLGLGRHDFVANVIQSTYFHQLNSTLGAALAVALLLLVALMVTVTFALGEFSPGDARRRFGGMRRSRPSQ